MLKITLAPYIFTLNTSCHAIYFMLAPVNVGRDIEKLCASKSFMNNRILKDLSITLTWSCRALPEILCGIFKIFLITFKCLAHKIVLFSHFRKPPPSKNTPRDLSIWCVVFRHNENKETTTKLMPPLLILGSGG